MAKIVTRDSLQLMLENDNPAYVAAVVGRALWALFQWQTRDEQSANTTNKNNNVGFTGADAKSGSITAKFWKKHHRLEQWQVDRWTKKGVNGFSRLAKYHRQLNNIAENK